MAGLPYLTFLASGIAASSAMNTASFEGMYSVYTRMVPQRTYDSILATPIEVDDIVAGEMLWCATKSTISGAAILAVAFAFGAVQGPAALLVLPIFFLSGLAFAGPALVMAALSQGYDFFSYYFTLFITPMFMLCGVFYPASALPEVLQPAVQALPLTHAVELIRPLMAGQATSGSAWHLLYLALFALLGYYLAAIFIRRRMIV
jgi:lipooligosaccharide transport system permease protein